MDAHAQQVDPRDAAFIITRTTTPWGEPLLAGLPHFWVGLSIALGKIGSSEGTDAVNNLIYSASIASLTIFALFCLGVIVYAWRHGWPMWTASWYGYAAWLLLIPIGLATVFLGGSSATNNVILFTVFGLLIIGYMLLFRASRLHALLVALFIMPVMSLFLIEAISNNIEAFLSIYFGLLAAGAAIAVVRWWSWPAGVTVALGANLIAGATLTYVAFFFPEIPDFYGDSNGDVLIFFAFYLAFTMLLFLGPLIFWQIWDRFSSRNLAIEGSE